MCIAKRVLLTISALAVFALGCERSPVGAPEELTEPVPMRGVAVLHGTEGNDVSGSVVFQSQASGVLVKGEVAGLSAGDHGFHIHEWGNCDCPDGTCAGGHFNPTDDPHAGPDDQERHVGDLGNISADESGKATVERVDTVLRLDGPSGIIGRAVVVHGGADDLKSQPSGDAGPRVACGVIGITATQ